MAVDVERLVVQLDADIRRYQKDLGRARQTTDQQMKKIETRFTAANRHIANFGKGLLAGFVAGGVTGIIGRIGEVARAVAAVGDEAKRAGVSVEAFQEWKFVAEQNRIGIDQMVDGLKELNLRADEFVQTGKGSAAEAFMRLGYGAEELQRKLKDPSELLLEIIDRLGKFDKAAQIRISDELFGGSAGERFVELIEQGEDGIRATIEQAHRLGIVMDRDVIERAAELDRRFNAITNTVATGLKTAIVEAATALQDFINSFDNMWDRYEQRRRAAELGAMVGSMAGQTTPPAGALGSRTTPKTGRLPKTEWVPPTPPPGGFGSSQSDKAARDRERAAMAAEREAEAVRRLIEELENELALIGATDLERETANLLRRAGAAATDEQRSKIVGLVAALHAEAEASRRASEAAAELQEIGRDVLGGMINDLRNGTSAADALSNALGRVADRLLDMALTSLLGGGGGGSILGSLFHNGGVVGQGGPTRRVHPLAFAGAPRMHSGGIAGLRPGEVPAILQRGEIVLPKGSSGQAQQQQAVHVTVGWSRTADGELKPFVESVSRGQAQDVTARGIAAYDRGKERQRMTGA